MIEQSVWGMASTVGQFGVPAIMLPRSWQQFSASSHNEQKRYQRGDRTVEATSAWAEFWCYVPIETIGGMVSPFSWSGGNPLVESVTPAGELQPTWCGWTGEVDYRVGIEAEGRISQMRLSIDHVDLPAYKATVYSQIDLGNVADVNHGYISVVDSGPVRCCRALKVLALTDDARTAVSAEEYGRMWDTMVLSAWWWFQ